MNDTRRSSASTTCASGPCRGLLGELARSGDPALSFAERFGLLVERQWSAREEAGWCGA